MMPIRVGVILTALGVLLSVAIFAYGGVRTICRWLPVCCIPCGLPACRARFS